jgi:hypothetical protein
MRGLGPGRDPLQPALVSTIDLTKWYGILEPWLYELLLRVALPAMVSSSRQTARSKLVRCKQRTLPLAVASPSPGRLQAA